jgi:hypothetical protein
LTTSEPEPFVAATPTIEVEPIRVLYAEETISAYRDPHLELADLLLAHETY